MSPHSPSLSGTGTPQWKTGNASIGLLTLPAISRNLPVSEELYKARVIKKSKSIISNEFHPANDLFEPMTTGTRYTSIRTDSTRTLDSFYPSAARLLDDQMQS